MVEEHPIYGDSVRKHIHSAVVEKYRIEFILVPLSEYIASYRDCVPGMELNYWDLYCPICRKPVWVEFDLSLLKDKYINYHPLDEDGMYTSRFPFQPLGLKGCSQIRIEIGDKPGKEGNSNIADFRIPDESFSVRENAFGLSPAECCNGHPGSTEEQNGRENDDHPQ